MRFFPRYSLAVTKGLHGRCKQQQSTRIFPHSLQHAYCHTCTPAFAIALFMLRNALRSVRKKKLLPVPQSIRNKTQMTDSDARFRHPMPHGTQLLKWCRWFGGGGATFQAAFLKSLEIYRKTAKIMILMERFDVADVGHTMRNVAVHPSSGFWSNTMLSASNYPVYYRALIYTSF